MKIGILVNKSKSIFTNGCIQQGYFLLKSFRKIGFECNFVTAFKDFKKFEVVDENIHCLTSSSDLDRYNVLVFSSGSIDNTSYMSYCKLNNIKMINLCVGNYYVINQEEFVFDLHKSNNVMARMYNKFMDQIWLMPMYRHNTNYMKYITKTSLEISPYVWDSTFIDMYSESKNLNLTYNPTKNLLDIVILEPNVSIHKTALVPLLICEEFYNKYPNKLGKIYFFCKPDSNFEEKLWYLNILKHEKVEFFERIISMDLFHNLNNLGKKYAVLSSNIRNGLNFLHLECFKLGIPIIHNCKPFKESGFYYQEDDLYDNYPEAIEHLLKIQGGNYSQNTKTILNTYSPYNEKNIDSYKKLLENIVSYEEPIINQILNNINKNNNKYRFSNRIAIVFCIKQYSDLTIINQNINILSKLKIECNFYIIDNKDILKSKPTKKYNIVNANQNKYIIQEVYSKILHNHIILVDSGYLIQFDVTQMINDCDISGVEIEENKDLINKDYYYYKSSIETCELIIKKNNPIKLFDLPLIYIKNSDNIINGIKEISKMDHIDELLFRNIIFHIYYNSKTSITMDKVLIYSEEGNIIGKGYSSNDTVLCYKCNNNSVKKNIIKDDKVYKFIDVLS